VVAAAVNGIPELIREGETGFLVPPEDPAALAAALARIVAAPEVAARLAARGRVLVEQHHPWSVVAPAYLALSARWPACAARGPPREERRHGTEGTRDRARRGDVRLLGPMMEAGRAARALPPGASGCHGELNSTFPPLTPPAWSAFMTGKNPGKHGVVSFRRAPAGYRTGDFINAKSLRARTLWEIVGETGRTVGAINVVPSYPVRAVNGFMVACMLAPPGAPDIIYPPEYRPLLGDDYLISLEPPKQLVATAPTTASRRSTTSPGSAASASAGSR